MIRRKPNPYEREALYLGAKEEAFKAGGSVEASYQWLAQIPWLHKLAVDSIAAKVTERIGAIYGKPTPTQENPA